MQMAREEVAKVSYCYYSRDSHEIVRKFPCLEAAKFTDRDRTFCPRPHADVFGRCARQRVKSPGNRHVTVADRDTDNAAACPHLVQLLVEGPRVLHVLYLVGALALIGSDDPNLVWPHPTTQKAGHQLLRIGCLCPVDIHV